MMRNIKLVALLFCMLFPNYAFAEKGLDGSTLTHNYDDCIKNPTITCLSYFAALNVPPNDGFVDRRESNEVLVPYNLLTAIGQTVDAKAIKDKWEFTSTSYVYDNSNRQRTIFGDTANANIATIQLAEKAGNNKELVRLLRIPSSTKQLSLVGLTTDSVPYLLGISGVAQVFAANKHPDKARRLLNKIEKYLPLSLDVNTIPYSPLHSSISDVEKTRAQTALAYAYLNEADKAINQLSQINASSPFTNYVWVNSALQLCKVGNQIKGRQLLTTYVDLSVKHNYIDRAVFSEAVDTCQYKGVLPEHLLFSKSIFSPIDYPRGFGSALEFYTKPLKTQRLENLERNTKQWKLEPVDQRWVFHNYNEEKIKTLLASGDFVKAKLAINDYRLYAKAGGQYQYAPAVLTKIARLEAKFGLCEDAKKDIKMAVNSLLVYPEKTPEYRQSTSQILIPHMLQALAVCGANDSEVDAMQIDFNYRNVFENIKNSQRADQIEIVEALVQAKNGDVKQAVSKLDRLSETHYKLSALLTLAETVPANYAEEIKKRLLKELVAMDDYFGIQHDAVGQRRVVGDFTKIIIKYKDTKNVLTYVPKLSEHAKRIPNVYYQSRALCEMGYMQETLKLKVQEDYFSEGVKRIYPHLDEHVTMQSVYVSPAGACAFFYKKAGKEQDAKKLLTKIMEGFYVRYESGSGEDFAKAAVMYWEYEHGELPEKWDNLLNYGNFNHGDNQISDFWRVIAGLEDF